MENANKYLDLLINKLHYAITKKNVNLLFNKIIENKTIKLWNGSAKRTEFVTIRRLLSIDKNKNVLDDKVISQSLLEIVASKLAEENKLLLLHDPCDMRQNILVN